MSNGDNLVTKAAGYTSARIGPALDRSVPPFQTGHLARLTGRGNRAAGFLHEATDPDDRSALDSPG